MAANHVSWDDLQLVFGPRGEPNRCQCQWFRVGPKQWRGMPREERAERLRDQTECGHPEAERTSGLVAYVDGEPAGWCAVEPRVEYERLLTSRIPWAGRSEDKSDDRVWAVVCFVTRTGFRRRGVMSALAAAAVDFARDRGASALEAYPMITKPGHEISWAELYVGSRGAFAAAGLTEVSHPTTRRVVMRIDF